MIPVRYPVLAGLILLSTFACKRDDDRFASGTGTSAFMDDASPDALEAMSIQVDYRLTDENFAKWEIAQRNLDRLPRSAFPERPASGGNVIDRAVARLESSPRARTTIEATGLTVRDFVLQTVALAQATQASQGGRVAGAGLVPPENFRFVERHRQRILRAHTAARLARRNAERAESQTEIQQDTLSDSGIAVSSDTASIESRPQAPVDARRSQTDSVRTDDDGSEAPPPPDTTRDSVSVEVSSAFRVT